MPPQGSRVDDAADRRAAARPMKLAATILWLAALMPIASSTAGADCDFDQQAVRDKLGSLANANPGGVLDAENHRVTWKDPARTVHVEYGGCVDLGSSVSVIFSDRVDTRTAVAEVIAATSRYRSAGYAAAAARVLATGQFETHRPAPALVAFEASKEASPMLPFGFILEVRATQASLSWQEL